MPSEQFVALLQDQVSILQERCRRLEADNRVLQSENLQYRDTIVLQATQSAVVANQLVDQNTKG